jgi:predicted RNase H-like HicB family nuclease
MQQVVFNVRFQATVHREGDWFVSFCPVLDVASQGKSEREALKNLAEASRLFLLSCYDRGTLDQVLKARGLRTMKKAAAQSTGKKDQLHIDVALPFSAPAKVKGRVEHCPA